MFEVVINAVNLFNQELFSELTLTDLQLIPFLNIVNIFAGFIAINSLLIHILKSAEIEYKIKAWKILTFILLMLILIYITLFQIEFIPLEGYKVFIISPNHQLLSFTVTLSTSIIVMLILGPYYINFSKEIKNKKSGKKQQISRFSFLIASSILIYVFSVISRIHFGSTWMFIIFFDILMVIGGAFSLYASLFYGFGEQILCIVNLEELYIAHKSGKLIHVEKYIDRETTKEDLISAFFIAANTMVSQIRSEGSGIERLILDDGSEIILSFGDNTRGILITKKFNNLFKNKLDQLIQGIEELPSPKLDEWSIGTLDLSLNISNLLKRIF